MSLSAGERLGPYEIFALIGAGGMGEVYRAGDPRLGRDVAIKVSAERFSERFEHEARAIASLNHPNICHLYDVGPNYLVMELIDGPTLAERIRQGAIPLDEALSVARQIAEALEAAHEKGIVHRDLKPGNVKIRPDGVVKVLDFGLAKTGGGRAIPSENSSTLTTAQTETGVILGTAPYMAPEQAKGKPVDKRADVYAFGVVLYEMLTGKRLHQGENTSEILASVIKEEPKWDQVPSQVRRLLHRCLEKDPQKRLRHIGDVMALVEDAPVVTPVPPKPERKWWLLPAVAAALAIALAVLAWDWWRATRLTDLPLVRQDVDLGADISLPGPLAFVPNIVISPDSTRVAFIATSPTGGATKLFTRRLDQPKAVELPDTEGAIGPFFSPDGRWLGFAAGPKLYKIPVDGGAALPLMDLNPVGFAGASWGEDGIVVAQRGDGMILSRIPAGGGAATPLTQLAEGERAHVSPQILPGGKAVLFAGSITSAEGSPDTANIDAASLADHKTKVLVKGGAFPRYVASFNGRSLGHLLYTFKGGLYAIPFDADKLEPRGTAVPILTDVLSEQTVAGKFDVSQTGTLVYQKGSFSGPGPTPGRNTIQWLDSTGKQQPLLAATGNYYNQRLSPDGKRLALVTRDRTNPQGDVQVYELQNDRPTRVTFGGQSYMFPVWKDDQYVVFGTLSGSIFWNRAAGSGKPQLLTSVKDSPLAPFSFSTDGKRLAYMQLNLALKSANAPQAPFKSEIWTIPVEEQNGRLKAGTAEVFLKDEFNDMEPAFSPDGRWLAYTSDESGKNEVYVRPFPPEASGQRGKASISNQGGGSPRWSPPPSHDLLYRAADGSVMVVTFRVNGDTFVPDKPRMWGPAHVNGAFDLSPDGKRLVVVVSPPGLAPTGRAPEHEVVFLQNFFDELRRRAPVSK